MSLTTEQFAALKFGDKIVTKWDPQPHLDVVVFAESSSDIVRAIGSFQLGTIYNYRKNEVLSLGWPGDSEREAAIAELIASAREAIVELESCGKGSRTGALEEAIAKVEAR